MGKSNKHRITSDRQMLWEISVDSPDLPQQEVVVPPALGAHFKVSGVTAVTAENRETTGSFCARLQATVSSEAQAFPSSLQWNFWATQPIISNY